MNSTAKQTGQSARDLAQKIAKQMAQEPLEVLKRAENQVTGEETREFQENPGGQDPDAQAKIREHHGELQDKMKSSRRMEAFQRELDDMRKQKLFKDLQNKIAQGVDVPIDDYGELSVEQKQVLKAQKQAVREQMAMQQAAGGQTLVEPASKKGRQLFNFGKKTEVKREQTHVEKPVPPSG